MCYHETQIAEDEGVHSVLKIIIKLDFFHTQLCVNYTFTMCKYSLGVGAGQGQLCYIFCLLFLVDKTCNSHSHNSRGRLSTKCKHRSYMRTMPSIFGGRSLCFLRQHPSIKCIHPIQPDIYGAFYLWQLLRELKSYKYFCNIVKKILYMWYVVFGFNLFNFSVFYHSMQFYAVFIYGFYLLGTNFCDFMDKYFRPLTLSDFL